MMMFGFVFIQYFYMCSEYECAYHIIICVFNWSSTISHCFPFVGPCDMISRHNIYLDTHTYIPSFLSIIVGTK